MEFFSDVGGDPLKPSLFELVAQEQLGGLLQPALKYVLSVSCTLVCFECSVVKGLCDIGVCTTVSAIFVASGEST